MARLFLFLLLTVFPISAAAADNSSCDPRENAAVCQLKIQRNDALDNLAVARGDLENIRKLDAKTAAYWREYMSGIPKGALLKVHMRDVCRWRGTQSKPVADMCEWWRRVMGAEHE